MVTISCLSSTSDYRAVTSFWCRDWQERLEENVVQLGCRKQGVLVFIGQMRPGTIPGFMLRLLASLYFHWCIGNLDQSIFYTTVEKPQKAGVHTIHFNWMSYLKVPAHLITTDRPSFCHLSLAGKWCFPHWPEMRKGMARLDISGPKATVKGHCCYGWERLFQGHGYHYNKGVCHLGM